MGSEGLIKGYLIRINGDNGIGPSLIELRSRELTLGRGAGNTVFLASTEISRRHAIMKYVPETHQWHLKDTSGNGISLNGVKIPKNSFVDLKEGDQITLSGQFVYRFASVRKAEVEATCSRLTNSVAEVQVNRTGTRVGLRSANAGCIPIIDVSEDQTPNSQGRRNDHDECLSDGSFENIGPPLPKRQKVCNTVASFPWVSPMDTAFLIPADSPKDLQETPRNTGSCAAGTNTADAETAKKLSLYRGVITKMESEKFQMTQKHKAQIEELLSKVETLQAEKAANDGTEIYKKILDLLEEEYSCGICTEIYVEATVMTCGHTFCDGCIKQWLKQKKECPSCRKPVGDPSSHTEMRNFIARFLALLPDSLKRK